MNAFNPNAGEERPAADFAAAPAGDGATRPPSFASDARLAGLGPLDAASREAFLAALSRGPTHAALLEAIVAAPDDDAPRLIYADWLDEAGDEPQAEFIRAQCAAASPAAADRERARQLARAADLVERHGHEWLRPLAGFGVDAARPRLDDFERGVLVSVRATVPFIAPERLFQVAPTLRRLVLRGSHARRRLFDLPHTERLSHLTIELISTDDFAALVASPRWKSLHTLALRKAWLKPDVVYALGRGTWPALKTLSLSDSVVQDSGATALASTLLLGRVETLELAAADLTWAGVRAIAFSSLASGLRTLVLDDNVLDDDALVALADSPYLTRLRRLSLSNPELSRPPKLGRGRNLFSRPGIAALVQSENFERLEELDLLGVGLDDAASLAITAGRLPSLRRLDLRENDDLSPEVVAELVETFRERGVDLLV